MKFTRLALVLACLVNSAPATCEGLQMNPQRNPSATGMGHVEEENAIHLAEIFAGEEFKILHKAWRCKILGASRDSFHVSGLGFRD